MGVVALATALLATPAALADDGASDVTFGLSIAVARVGGAPVRDDAWIFAQLESANELYAPLGVRFRWTVDKALDETHAEMHTRADRDALAPLGEPRGIVDVFVVASLEDVDEPGRMRKGVCWTSHPDKRRYIVLSAAAPREVLAHELGHFFGNGHSTVPDNVMSYTRTGESVFFDRAQSARIRAFARGFLESRRLVDVGPARLLP